MLTDSFNRIHDYLRISLTDQCNFRCLYCMPDEQIKFMPAKHLMQAGEIGEIASKFVDLGIKKIRLTGGEPLVRKDFQDIIILLAKLPIELTLTTNGVFIKENMNAILDAGIKSINISLDTLQPEKFRKITQRDKFNTVMENIQLLLDKQLHVKINVVAMKGVNEDEFCDFIELSRNKPVHLRFIEFMPFSGNHWEKDQVIGMDSILHTISSKFSYQKLLDNKHDTAKKFQVNNFAGTFAIISTMSEPFCQGCNRIRITADGKIKNCLFSKEESDLLSQLRNGQDILPVILKSIGSKHQKQGGQFAETYELTDSNLIVNRSMINIGG